jgi:hypothetical protein
VSEGTKSPLILLIFLFSVMEYCLSSLASHKCFL